MAFPSLIADEKELAEFIHSLIDRGVEVCALDTEADSLYSYQEKICLIQFSDHGGSFLIDPLAIPDLEALYTFIESKKLWLHGSDYDLALMKKKFGRVPRHIFDTQIAARLSGHRKFSLVDLVKHYTGIELSKTAQIENWGLRPLPKKMQEYALNDVRYILPIAEKLEAELDRLGRREWFLQSCAALRESVVTREEKKGNWRISGAGKFKPKELHYLRALWYWRDEEGSLLDRPPFRILSNKALLNYAVQLANHRKVTPPSRLKSKQKKRFVEAIEKSLQVEEKDWPHQKKNLRLHIGEKERAYYEDLREKRDRIAQELDIEATLIASRNILEKIMFHQEKSRELLLPWQHALLFE